jgi:hypothetical protein
MKRRFAVVVALLLVALAPPAWGQQGIPEDARAAMDDFLAAWLVRDDMPGALKHFSTTDRAMEVAPRSVWELYQERKYVSSREADAMMTAEQQEAYWAVLRNMTPPHMRRLAAIDSKLRDFVHHDLRVPVVHEDKFIVFAAFRGGNDGEDAGVDDVVGTFDGGYGDVAAALRDYDQVLTMIADFEYRDHATYHGPFVSFWAKEAEAESHWQHTAEPDGYVWKIQALGAAPDTRGFPPEVPSAR